ncbi:probable palmitoyltransferase ZDHHC17 at N-terminal half [Coccomyxa sp. Obi]|nr:probable palmitoyltransferase ZDHHC17 at N-terminal half [Coccomyxa sp. Obi]
MTHFGTASLNEAGLRSPGQHRLDPQIVKHAHNHKDALKAARGWQICGIDRSVWIFVLAHGGLVALLLLSDSELSRRIAGATTTGAGYFTWDCAYVALVIACLALHVVLYMRLYRSDPGWVGPGDGQAAEEGTLRQNCPHCGAFPPERSKHDFKTGRCVAKFDHFCPLIASSVGDLNHSLFWFYCVFQAFLIAWAWFVTPDAAIFCLYGTSRESVTCWLLLAAVLLLVPLFNFFGGLALLHGYLAASGRTSYEICKGAKVPYLQPYYERYRGPAHFGLDPKGLASLLRELRKGNAPPAPYSLGVAENLNVFFFEKKPFLYRRSDVSHGSV